MPIKWLQTGVVFDNLKQSIGQQDIHILIMLFLILALTYAKDISYFSTGMFEKNRDPGMYKVKIGLEGEDLIVSAFGYFNKDK